MSRAALAVIVILLFAAGIAAADDEHGDHDRDQDVHVKVAVQANDGTPIAGATVSLSGGNFVRYGRSDARGIVELKHLRAGTYALHAVAPGYQPISQRTVSIARDDEHLSVVLYPATTNSLTVIGQV
ncbi:MAG TPA: carboxypeptidase-like regulatory domain-containing protein, partial [Candidatus Cybelea sp.]